MWTPEGRIKSVHNCEVSIHSDKYFLKHTGANLVNELFSFCLVNRQAYQSVVMKLNGQASGKLRGPGETVVGCPHGRGVHRAGFYCILSPVQVDEILTLGADELRRILGKSFWSSCVRFTFADLLTLI